MTLEPFEHDQFGKNDMWATVRSKVRDLCDQRGIKLSSIDLVRFRWMEEDNDGEETPYTTPVTIGSGYCRILSRPRSRSIPPTI
jgi:hypothetical protein